MKILWNKCHLSDKYSVSNKGEIRNDKTGKIIKSHVSSRGYNRVHLALHTGRITIKSCRLVLFAFKPKEHFEKATVNHKDGNKLNDNLENLEWCTNEDNIKHAKETGLLKRGEDVTSSKLTDIEILEIRKLYNEGIQPKELKKLFNVSQGTINRIVNNKTWTHLPWEPRPSLPKKKRVSSLYGSNKLKQSDILLIKEMYKKIQNYTKVAKQFNISETTVRKTVKTQ